MVQVEIEDHQQDFSRFDIEQLGDRDEGIICGTIIGTYPTQGWLWNGRKIMVNTDNNEIAIQSRRSDALSFFILNYKATKISEIEDHQ